MLAQSPALGGSVKRVDDAAASKMPGVRHVETSIAVSTFKYDHRVAKLTARPKGGSREAGARELRSSAPTLARLRHGQ